MGFDQIEGLTAVRTLAIGDIHGVSGALDALMEFVGPTADDALVFLGDYVDRGPDSKGVLDRLIAWSQSLQLVCLRGNHELLMMNARHGRDDLRMWLAVGGSQALASYGRGTGGILEPVLSVRKEMTDDIRSRGLECGNQFAGGE